MYRIATVSLCLVCGLALSNPARSKEPAWPAPSPGGPDRDLARHEQQHGRPDRAGQDAALERRQRVCPGEEGRPASCCSGGGFPDAARRHCRITRYVRQILPLTDDLDRVSEELFKLTTNGGDEYCGWVIKDAVNRLEWSRSGEVYKGIFIAGNEPFTQGRIDVHTSCRAAIARGIVVNTIFCGPTSQGELIGWKKTARRCWPTGVT